MRAVVLVPMQWCLLWCLPWCLIVTMLAVVHVVLAAVLVVLATGLVVLAVLLVLPVILVVLAVMLVVAPVLVVLTAAKTFATHSIGTSIIIGRLCIRARESTTECLGRLETFIGTLVKTWEASCWLWLLGVNLYPKTEALVASTDHGMLSGGPLNDKWLCLSKPLYHLVGRRSVLAWIASRYRPWACIHFNTLTANLVYLTKELQNPQWWRTLAVHLVIDIENAKGHRPQFVLGWPVSSWMGRVYKRASSTHFVYIE